MDPINADDSWKVIDSYFKMNGLVYQQIQSFQGFLRNSVQEVVNEFAVNTIEKQRQYYGDNDEAATYEVRFGNVTINEFPRYQESDNTHHALWPHEARIRSMTYQTEIMVDFQFNKIWTETDEDGEEVKRSETLYENSKSPIGKIPVMVRSEFCHLSTLNKDQIVRDAKECRYD